MQAFFSIFMKFFHVFYLDEFIAIKLKNNPLFNVFMIKYKCNLFYKQRG